MTCQRNGCHFDVKENGWCRKHAPFNSYMIETTQAALEWERDYLKREVELLSEEVNNLKVLLGRTVAL